MRRMLAMILRWSTFTAVLALAVHAATLYVIPGFLMARALAQASQGAGVNMMVFPRLASSGTADSIVATCVFNLAQNAVHMNAALPSQGNWSLTLYGEDAKPFFFETYEPGGDKMIDAWLIEPGGTADDAPPGAMLTHAPTFSGLMVVRASVSDASLAESDRVRHQASCQPISR